MIVLDTNVLSELMRPSPTTEVVEWLNAASVRDDIATTAITVAEILYGIERLPTGRRKQQPADSAATMFDKDFVGAILAFDVQAATYYAKGVARSEADGYQWPMAAIRCLHSATLATRNTRDFLSLDVALINPWEAV